MGEGEIKGILYDTYIHDLGRKPDLRLKYYECNPTIIINLRNW